ncbi:helix-turn-helix domain-containing protein [Eleftheria terrae]|uniref:helix-turn-helix domain-containing protein n=1 Tax=Eleftheria terrae TaxID=1597781 RepID=UPI00263B58E5|nr:helix-turn-helix domain-containing protein [Eleftheria terrae]WKB53102.1 helix-turn-helix domain-containing protein [Eleftheria terrae]
MFDAKDLPSPRDPGQALAAVLALRLMADRLEQQAVAHALQQGWSWADIAEALGVTKQAAHKRLAPWVQR